MNTESTFTLSHEKETFDVSFFDYFTKRYGVEITQKKQPLILAVKTNPVNKNGDLLDSKPEDCYLIPELCYLVGMTD